MIIAVDARNAVEERLKKDYLDLIDQAIHQAIELREFSVSLLYEKIPLASVIKKELERCGYKVCANRDSWSISW